MTVARLQDEMASAGHTVETVNARLRAAARLRNAMASATNTAGVMKGKYARLRAAARMHKRVASAGHMVEQVNARLKAAVCLLDGMACALRTAEKKTCANIQDAKTPRVMGQSFVSHMVEANAASP